jgi:ribosome biogenesis GTPase A
MFKINYFNISYKLIKLYIQAEHEYLYLQQPELPENPKLLKVSVLGVPNSGKSTLVNRLMNRRVSKLFYESLAK